MDSDDRLAPSTYRPLLAELSAHAEWDIVEFPVSREHSDSQWREMLFDDKTYRSVYDYWTSCRGYAHSYAWNKLFRRTLFADGLHFEGLIFEDIAFMAEVVRRHPVIHTSSSGQYLYCHSPHGLTHTADGNALLSLLRSNLRAAHNAGLRFLSQREGTYVAAAEADCYLSLLNIQLSVINTTAAEPLPPSHTTAAEPLLPSHRLHLSREHLSHCPTLLKVAALNLIGLRRLCQLSRLVP